jgi:hypothetical protein
MNCRSTAQAITKLALKQMLLRQSFEYRHWMKGNKSTANSSSENKEGWHRVGT